MNKDSQFKNENLLDIPSFRAWVYYGVNDPLWQEWITQNPDRLSDLETARNILLSIRGEVDNLSINEVKEKVQDILHSSQIENKIKQSVTFKKDVNILWLKHKWNFAASIFLLIGLGWFMFSLTNNPNKSYLLSDFSKHQMQINLEEVVNTSDEVKLVNLPDGSSVLLMKDSKIRFPKKFKIDKRETYLLGEAFFQVQKNPVNPFYVYAGEIVTKVLGTSFGIKAYDHDENISVIVKSGKVSVYAQNTQLSQSYRAKTSQAITLIQNQQAIISREDLKIKLYTDKRLEFNNPMGDQTFEFKRTPISEVFDIIEKRYNVSITYDSNILKNCTITANLGDEPLMEKLNMICTVIEATYEVINEKIIINANGCGN